MTKNKALPRLRGICATLGALFLVFPTVGLYDLMPDFIGWILIYVSVSELAFFSEELAGLKKLTVYLSVLSAARFTIGLMMVERINSEAMTDTNAFMTAATVLAVCEIICVILYSKYFFAGMETVCSRNGGSSSLNAISDARFLTSSFFITRIVLTLVPELFPLAQSRAYIDLDNAAMWESVYALKMPMTLLCLLISLSFGVYFLFIWRKMFRILRNDEPLVSALASRYAGEVTHDSNRVKADRFRSGLFLISLGLFFFINLVLDFKYLTPKFVGVALIFAGALRMRRCGDFRKTMTCCYIALPILIASYLFRFTTAGSFFREISLFAAYIGMGTTDKVLHGVFGTLEAGALIALFKTLYDDICSAASLAVEKNIDRSFLSSRITVYLYIAVNLAMFAFPPARQVLVEADLLVTAAWLFFSLRLFSKINSELTYKYIYS